MTKTWVTNYTGDIINNFWIIIQQADQPWIVAAKTLITKLEYRPGIPSGFLGVDVFFAISGFVVTASLLNQRRTTLSQLYVNFLGRRVKRLMPALTVSVALFAWLYEEYQSAAITTDDTAAALKEIHYEINRLHDEALPQEELKAIQNYMAGIFTLRNSSRRESSTCLTRSHCTARMIVT